MAACPDTAHDNDTVFKPGRCPQCGQPARPHDARIAYKTRAYGCAGCGTTDLYRVGPNDANPLCKVCGTRVYRRLNNGGIMRVRLAGVE